MTRYVMIMLATVAIFCGAVWIAAPRLQIYFQESGYSVWRAKYDIIDHCDLGSIVILGDSRAQSAFVPTRLKVKASNLSFGAATPLEVFITMSKVLKCNNMPKYINLSLASVEFTLIQKFLWENGARYGFFGWRDLRTIASAERALNDNTVEKVYTRDGENGIVRDIIYGLQFPSIYFNSIVQGRLFGRYNINRRLLNEALEQRGFLPFKNSEIRNTPGREVGYISFRPLTIQDYFFDQILLMAKQNNVTINFIASPIKTLTSDRMSIAFKNEFINYIQAYERKYPNFHVVSPLFYTMRDAYFADAEHLNIDGARNFTDSVSECSPSPDQICLH